MREKKQGKINYFLLLAHQHGQGGSIEAVKREVRSAIEAFIGRELLSLLVTEGGVVVHTPFRQEFWNMCKMVHLFYMEEWRTVGTLARWFSSRWGYIREHLDSPA